MTKLVVISTEFPPGPGGIGHHAYSLCNTLHQKGKEITVLTSADFADAKRVEVFDQQQLYPVIRFPRNGWRTYLQRLRITHRETRKNRPDYIILTGKFSLWIGLYLKVFFSGTPTIAILHGSEVNLANRFLRMLTHYSINAADHIVAVSNFTASLLPSFIKNKRNIAIIPNGIETNELSTYLRDKNFTLQGEPALLTVGHVSPRKGQHRVIKALPVILPEYPKAHFHMVGRPIFEPELRLLAKKLGVEGHITFHGVASNHSDLAQYYIAADIFMLLSENQPNGDVEGFGIVALEANYFGLPVIGARFCGVEDAVDPGQSGYLVDGDNTNEISEAIQWCLRNKEELSSQSKVWAQSHEWTKVVEEYLQIIT